MTSQRTRDYEVVMVLSPESTEDEAKSTVNRITEIITQQGGEITHEENWGVRRLAYPIKRFVEGNYFLARFRLESDGVLELNQTLNAAQDVLRHLVMRMDKDALAALEAKTALEARRKAEAEARAERDAREAEEARERAEAAEAQAEAAPAAETPVAEAEEVAEEPEPETEEPVAEVEAEATSDEPETTAESDESEDEEKPAESQ